MTTALWCLLIAILMPYIFAGIAKANGSGRYNNHAPRDYLANQQGLSKRADWAQQNSFEALIVYSASLLAAMLAGVPNRWLAILSVAFIAARILYGFCYLKDWASARSLCWFAGLFCCLGLLIMAALRA
jgi:uncharacterized MAPEG superfamily protein